jgi:hypothetical protein
VVAVVAGVFAVTGLSGVPGFVTFSGFGYLLAQTGLSVVVEGRRRAIDRLWTALVHLAFVAASLPLLLICWYTIQRGIGMIDLTFLTHSMFRVNPQNPGGGVYHAIVGTLIQALLATVLATPLGILTSIYLVEYGGGRRFARLVNFFVDVMTGGHQPADRAQPVRRPRVAAPTGVIAHAHLRAVRGRGGQHRGATVRTGLERRARVDHAHRAAQSARPAHHPARPYPRITPRITPGQPESARRQPTRCIVRPRPGNVTRHRQEELVP